MANLTAVQRRAAIRALVLNTISPRISALREETDAHWYAIMGEVASAADIKTANRITTDLVRYRSQVHLALNLADAWIDSDWCEDKDLHVRTINFLVPENNAVDPLGVLPGFGYDQMADSLKEAWKQAGPEVKYKMKTALKILSTNPPPKDIPGQCSIQNPDTYKDNVLSIDVDMYVPNDCRTEREFRSRVEKIAKDANNLFEGLQEATRNCRSVESFVKVVPEIEKYIQDPGEVPVVKTSNINTLLKKAANG